MAKPVHVLLFGTGAVGTVYAYFLHNGGAKVTTVCRTNYKAAKAFGFTLKSPVFGDVNFHPDNVVQSSAEAVQNGAGPFDFILVTAKSLLGLDPSQTELIAPAVVKGHTAIILAQNGIGIEKEYAERFPENPIISAVVRLPVTQISPAVVQHKGLNQHLHIGTYPSDAPATYRESAERFVAVFRKGGGGITIHEDIQLERWKKVAINALLNPLCALTRSRDAEIAQSSPGAVKYLEDIMVEITNVARAVGYEVGNEQTAKDFVEVIRTKELPGSEPSMLGDALGGRAMEVEAIVGNVVRIAEEKNVNVSLLNGVYVLTKALDKSRHR